MHSVIRFSLAALAIGLSACASTTLDNSWKDPHYSGGPLSKILVVGISSQASVRRAFEDTFAQSLTQSGVQAVPSYTLIPQDGRIAEDVLQKAVGEAGANGVLIARMVGRETELTVTTAPMAPPIYGMRRSYYGYYSGAWAGYYEPATVQQFDYIVTETTLFRADAPEPIWSGTARTLEPKDVRKATEGFAKVMIDALKKEGLI
jgi:hypothetical protein